MFVPGVSPTTAPLGPPPTTETHPSPARHECHRPAPTPVGPGPRGITIADLRGRTSTIDHHQPGTNVTAASTHANGAGTPGIPIAGLEPDRHIDHHQPGTNVTGLHDGTWARTPGISPSGFP